MVETEFVARDGVVLLRARCAPLFCLKTGANWLWFGIRCDKISREIGQFFSTV